MSVGYFLVALSYIVSDVWCRERAYKVVSEAKEVQWEFDNTTLYAVNRSWFCTGVLFSVLCYYVTLRFVELFSSFLPFLFLSLKMCSSC